MPPGWRAVIEEEFHIMRVISKPAAAVLAASLALTLSGPNVLAQTAQSPSTYTFKNSIFSTLPGPDDILGGRAGYEDNAGAPQRQAAAAAFHVLQLAPAALTQPWELLGPTTGNVSGPWTYTGRPSVVSGRITGLAISPSCDSESCPLFVAAAGGGIWRTMNGLSPTPQWTSVSQGLPTNAVGSIIFDPTDQHHRTLYVGTGEINGSSDSEAGLGLFKSTDLGDSWTLVAGSAAVAANRAIGAVAVDPANANHLLIGTGVARHGLSSTYGGRLTPPGAPQIGLYESHDGGQTFTLAFSQPSDTVNPATANGSDFFRGGVTKIEAYRSGEESRGPTQFYFSVEDYGLYRSAAGGGYEQVFASAGGGSVAGSLASRTEFDLAPMEEGLRIYVADADSSGIANLYRTDNANVPASQLTGTSGNTGWTLLTSAVSGTPGFGAYAFCGGQCTYDMFVASPAGHPDTVWIGGQMQYNDIFVIPTLSNGRAVMRSTNAGASFTDMTNDTAQPLPNGMHPDQHAIVFAPGQPDIAIIGSDGGLVRTDGAFVNTSQFCGPNPNPATPNPAYRNLTGTALTNCQLWLSSVPRQIYVLNSGLATLQYQGIAFDPRDPRGSLIGGTQDNGTWEWDGTKWLETVGGDGGQAGISTLGTRMHTYTGAVGDINFSANNPLGWDIWEVPSYQNPTNEASAFYTPLAVDLRNPGTWFVGLQHVWRTTDDLGGQTYMDLYCNEFVGTLAQPCGDWQALGGAGGPGNPGDLVSALYGTDKAGSWVAWIAQGDPNAQGAAERSPLWVGTRRGRVFISTNPNEPTAANVVFTRIDTASQPTRYVSAIAVDPKHTTHAYISFSGYQAYTPTTPGHVFFVRYNRESKTATWTDISANLGDQPILGVALDSQTGNLFAATDYGVAVLTAGSSSWSVAGSGLPPVAVYQLVIDSSSRTLYAVTHGRGIYRLDL
jgi:hypothetical protein